MIASALSDAAEQAISAGRIAEGKVLWLLTDAASMTLKPKSKNEPFAPSILLENFSIADIGFFTEIVDQVDDARLRGRLADLVWLRSKPRDPKYALMAIDAYRELNLDVETWSSDGRECWMRAIQLAKSLGKGSGNRLAEMRDAILEVFNSATTDDGRLAYELSDLLDEKRLPHEYSRLIGVQLETLAKGFEASSNFFCCRDYFTSASSWFKKAGEAAKSAEMTAALAESWVREAQARVSTEQSGHMVAVTFYENSIQAYRTIPRAERGPYNVDERILELRGYLSEAGKKSLDEMISISIPGTDISEVVKQAQDAVRGKDASDALIMFTNFYPGFDTKTIRDLVTQTDNNNLLMSLFPATIISGDGRVVAKQPGMNLSDSDTCNNEKVIWNSMIERHKRLISFAVESMILPALQILMQEHHLPEKYFEELCMQSPIIPKDRVRLWGKALYAGYSGDFITAIHLLCPQVEHMIRMYLKNAGVITTNLSPEGIETENGLCTLMEMPEVDKVIDPNLTFEIKALFCGPPGSNIRNNVAHGLISPDGCQSFDSIYAWWLALRCVFKYRNAVRKANTD